MNAEDSQWINVDKIVGTAWIPIDLEVNKERGQATGVELKENSIPLTYVLDECQKTTQGFFGPVIKLLCPEFQQLPKDLVKYSSLNGFDPRLCYGDITLHFVFKGEYKFKGGPQQDVEEVHDLMGLESSWSSSMKSQAARNFSHVFEDVPLKKIIFCKYCDNRAQPKAAAPPVPLAESDREFFRKLELSDSASGLNTVLKNLQAKQYGLRMYAVAVEEARHIHEDLPPEQRMERVRNVYHRVKAAFEKEQRERLQVQSKSKAGLSSPLASSEERIKHLNLVLLYYASGLKHIYEKEVSH
ncbi:hypothetical protein V5799_007658 [Amblyomma americanum]|uniref:Uncharacterized protein n=1 Tax=Amblyomma americanum TaxID=6943 RepID=A0AAQ4FFB6_AMBAM